MHNNTTVAEIKRQGMAAIEESRQPGPLPAPEMTALQWLLTQPSAGMREKADIDTTLAQERAW